MANAADSTVAKVRELTSLCDWCGSECSGQVELCVRLSCQRCEPRIYHQDCVEKYLKKHGFPKARLSGFPCPYGKGKGCDNACKGKIDSSHAICPKNEEKKKARMVMPAVVEALQVRPPKAPKNAPKAPAAKGPAPPRQATVPKAPVVKPPIIHRAVPPQPLGLNRMAGNAAGAGATNNVWALRGAAPVIAGAHTPPEALPGLPAVQHLAAGNTPAQLPVGMVLEEAAGGEALSKALRKNLARREKKRQQAAMQDAASEGSFDLNSDAGVAEQYEANVGGAFDTPAAGADGAGSAYVGSGSGFEMIGYDGAAIRVQDNFPGQPGQRFLDAAAYARLVGNAMSDEEDDDEGVEYYQAEVQELPAGDTALQGAHSDQAVSWTTYEPNPPSLASGYGPPPPVPAHVPVAIPVVAPVAVPVVAPVAVPVAVPVATPPPAAPVVEGKDATSDQASFDAAIQASIAQYHVEQEMRKQREALVNGFSKLGSHARNQPTPGGFYPTPGAPVAAPVVAPVAVPPPAPPVVFNRTKQQPEAPAGYGNQGWVFGGVNQAAGALPPHFPAGYAQFESSPVPSMAAGHSAPEVAESDEDDDGLSTLLALCGVAG